MRMSTAGKAFRIMGLCLGLVLTGTGVANSGEVPRISKEKLKAWLGNSDLVILDVMREEDWRLSERKIKGAKREEAPKVESWAHKYNKDKTLVLYCT